MALTPEELAQIEDDLVALSSSPLISKTVEGTVQERTAKDMIELDQYLSGKAAGSGPAYGMRIARVRPGGTVN